MGLDMYLYADRYVSSYFHEGDDEKAETIKKLFPELKIGEIKNIRVEVAYWRKANAIHNWFVKNVQEGVDDCGNYYVSRDKLKELIALIEEVLTNKKSASKNLPTAAGFFFGSTDIDDYYFEDLKYSLDTLKEVAKLPDSLELYYHSSW
jgi:hypothetical protein